MFLTLITDDFYHKSIISFIVLLDYFDLAFGKLVNCHFLRCRVAIQYRRGEGGGLVGPAGSTVLLGLVVRPVTSDPAR